MSENTDNHKPAYIFSKMYDGEVERLSFAAKKFIALEYQYIQQYIAANSRIADIGCGTGEITNVMAETNPSSNVFGYDIDPAAIKSGKTLVGKKENLFFSEHSLQNEVLFPDGPFDFILLRLVLLHNSEPVKLLNALKKNLKPGGRLYVIDVDDRYIEFSPTAAWQKILIDTFQRVQTSLGGDRHLGAKLCGLLKEAGLTDIDV